MRRIVARTSYRTAALAAVAWVVAASITNAMQTPVDFSGRWVLESEPLPAVATELVVRQISGPGALPKQISVTRHGPAGPSTETLHVGTFGGTVPGTGGGPRTSRRVTWQGSTLVIEVETLRSQTGARSQIEQRREVWSVTPDGKLQIVITESGPSRTLHTMTLVYRQDFADSHITSTT